MVKKIFIKAGVFFLIIGLPGHLTMIWCIAHGGIDFALQANLIGNFIAYMWPLTWVVLPLFAIFAAIYVGNGKPSKTL